MKIIPTIIHGLILLAAGTLLAACNQTQEDFVDSENISIVANGQGTFHNLRIGIGFIGDDPEILKTEGKHVPAAQLWPFVKDETAGRPSLLVHKGDQVDIDNYHLEIKKIDHNSVTINFKELKPK